jgi:hypothetical protein
MATAIALKQNDGSVRDYLILELREIFLRDFSFGLHV